MITQFLTCPHCGTGFATPDEVEAHGREVHRDVTPKQHDLETKVYSPTDLAQRRERDEQDAENLKKGVERI
jgi:uncharacterized Zn finger protein (UPF0148 family)